MLENCVIGPHVTIGQGAEIRRARIENSILLDNCVIDCDLYIRDSMIGKKAEVIKKDNSESKKMFIGDKTTVEI